MGALVMYLSVLSLTFGAFSQHVGHIQNKLHHATGLFHE